MAKKKQTKAERLAKAKAYANKMTVGKALGAYALGGGGVRQVLGYMDSGNIDWMKVGLLENYTGYNSTMKEFDFKKLSRGWGGTITYAGEKAAFKFMGIKGPRSKIETVGDVLDWSTYFMGAGLNAYENKDNFQNAHIETYKALYGVDLNKKGWEAFEPLGEMIGNKIVPYVIQKKIRQIPFVKRQLAALNKMMG